jgi:Glutamine amidotransferases class-II
MCLLIKQTARSPRLSSQWLQDFYSRNSDGLGVMYADNGQLVIHKQLPKTAAQLEAFYSEHIHGRDCFFHLRMQTHGDIDLLNCHPYEVLNMAEHGRDLWLMHNGVLSTGNAADTSKSDTWHYINDYLRPMLADNPDFAFSAAFAEVIGAHIGVSNKFALLDNLGQSAVINERSGVYWGGLWISNTYAWSAPSSANKSGHSGFKKQKKQIAQPPQRFSYSYAGYRGFWEDDEYPAYEVRPAATYEDDYLEHIESNLDDLHYLGYPEAAAVSLRSCENFVLTFGLESFFELCEMVIDSNISQDWFVKAMTDHKAAREAFPYLAKAEQRGIYAE